MQRRQAATTSSTNPTTASSFSRTNGNSASDSSSPTKNVPPNNVSSSSMLRSPNGASSTGTPHGPPTGNSYSHSNNSRISTGMLLLLAFLLTLANYQISTPPQVQQVEHDLFEGAREAEHVMEQEMRDWWGSRNGPQQQQQPPPLSSNNNVEQQQRRAVAERMASQRQPHQQSWVEGEQRLKRELQKLVALQQQGQELGVPVLTRWLGEDIPAWAGTGVDRDAWQAQVQARYKEMRLEEEHWRARVADTIQAENRG